MKHLKRFVQKTIREDDPAMFDKRVNEVYLVASQGGRAPEIHYFEGCGLCATIRFWVEELVAEGIADEFELRGEGAKCSECPLFELPKDRRIKSVRCSQVHRLVDAQTPACDRYYEALIKGEEKERRELTC